MYIFKNALKNLGRNKGRNILTGLITLAIIIAVSVSIVISTAGNSVAKSYKARFGAEVTLFLDTELASQYSDVRYPTAQQQIEIARSSLLQKTDFESTLSVALQGLAALGGKMSSLARLSGSDEIPPAARIKATSDPNISGDFTSGKRTIVQGRAFQAPNECIISEEFAQLNDLSVGDPITVTNTSEKSLMPHTFTVCGIYRDNLTAENAGMNIPLLNPGNEILTDLDTALEMEMYAVRGQLNATYFLKDPGLLESFQAEAADKGLPPYYRVTADEDAYNKTVGPVEGISRIVTIFLIVVLIFGSVILVFLSGMAIRERKYEIGVLRAMGMKRGRVMAGMVCESLIIALICLCIGLALSIPLSLPIADTLLKDQIRIAEEQKQNNETILLVSDEEEENIILELSIQLTPQTIGQIVGLAIILVLISSIAGILCITRFEPMKILSERS